MASRDELNEHRSCNLCIKNDNIREEEEEEDANERRRR